MAFHSPYHKQHQNLFAMVQLGHKEDVTQPHRLEERLPYLNATRKEDQPHLNKTQCLQKPCTRPVITNHFDGM